MLKFKFKIVTPDRIVYQDEVEEVIIPTTSGQIGVLAKHTPLVSLLAPGELIIKKGGEPVYMAVSHGVIEMRTDSELVILADTAERAEEIDIEKAQAARQRAEELLTEKENAAEADFVKFEALLDREMTRIKVAEKYRRHHHN